MNETEKTVAYPSAAYFLQKANLLTPTLQRVDVHPVSLIELYQGTEDWAFREQAPIGQLFTRTFQKGDRVLIDFGTHCVGYVHLSISPVGSPPDAPAYIKVKFGEHLCEMAEDSSDYHGSLSASWIQEEFVHVDVMPAELDLKRRYAFRFMEIVIKETSPKYQIKIDHLSCETVSSADMNTVPVISCGDPLLNEIDRVSVKTMHDCMQAVFEDGPKRDRRLWIGDLRLQALTNYETFQNNDLVKRCLYLFAGLCQEDGRVSACVFTKPSPITDDTVLFDYSLFFVSCLHDYYMHTKDLACVKELWETACRQIAIAKTYLGEDGVLRDRNDWWCFVDWNDALNKQASAQAIFIYAVKQACTLADVLKDEEKKREFEELSDTLIDGAKHVLWDASKDFFVSGAERQISWASQIWFVLAQVFSKEENAALLKRLIQKNPSVKMITPYLYHHFIEALWISGMQTEAIQYLKSYWGGMIADGADCFYELYDPANKLASPYGSRIINSYCHAWSGTPAYFIRKYLC